MAPLGVDPAALDSAGAEVVTAGQGPGSAISTLTSALSGSGGMAGDDPVGAALGRDYDGAATKLIEAMVDTRNGVCSIGDGVRMSAHNYSLAEAMSNVSGRAAPVAAPQMTGPMSAGSAPSAVGAGSGPPAGWGWVAPYIGMIWPTGDSGKLRAAAAAWSAAGTQFALAEILGTGGPMGTVRAQQIPEGRAIDRAFTDAYDSTTSIVQQCQKIAAQLNSYADKVDHVHAAILDLLARICDPMTGIKEIWDVLTDEDEDEIKHIADDIKTVVDNFAGEVDALGDQIAATVSTATTAATTMGRYAAKEWDHFLHGTEVGKVVNQAGQVFKGVGEEAGEFVQGLWEFSPQRFQVDPVGYVNDLTRMVQGEAPLVGLGGDNAPGVLESWKALGKGVTHWDEWSKNPAEAAGKTAFDVATLALPGGPLSKVGKAGRTAADALRGLRTPRPDLPKPPSIEPPTKPPVPAGPPRGPEPPEPGRPAPAPSGKPVPGPADGPVSHGPTESKPPVVEKPPAGEPPKPIGAPAESGGKPPVPAPAEQVPAPHPKPPEPVQLPATPVANPAEPVPSAAHPPEPAPAAPPTAPAPHLPTPASPGGVPAEAPSPFGGVPHDGEPHVHSPHQPHGGAPHAPGDGAAPHQPGDGHKPHHPSGDGGPNDHGHGHSGDADPPKARDIFPNATEFGELTEDEYRTRFEDENRELIYPDVDDPAKPYAIPGTVRELTQGDISALDGQRVDRVGYPGGNWLAFEGTPYEGRALPHVSLDKPYFSYTINAAAGLPPGWKIEFSRAAPWFGQPGGEPQLLIMAPRGERPSVGALLDRKFLTSD
jgi:Tuberculosis necrotizing toxin